MVWLWDWELEKWYEIERVWNAPDVGVKKEEPKAVEKKEEEILIPVEEKNQGMGKWVLCEMEVKRWGEKAENMKWIERRKEEVKLATNAERMKSLPTTAITSEMAVATKEQKKEKLLMKKKARKDKRFGDVSLMR